MERCPVCLQHLQPSQPTPLSPREIEVLEYLARGYQNKEIIVKARMAEQTLKNALSSILHKLHVQNRTAAVVVALKQRWIALPEEIHEISRD